MSVLLRFSVVVHVVADIDADGSIRSTTPPDPAALRAAIELATTPENRAYRVAQATRSRLSEGLVRVRSHGGTRLHFSYLKLVRVTKLHVVLVHPSAPDAEPSKFSLRTGARVGDTGWDATSLDKEDQAALARATPAELISFGAKKVVDG